MTNIECFILVGIFSMMVLIIFFALDYKIASTKELIHKCIERIDSVDWHITNIDNSLDGIADALEPIRMDVECINDKLVVTNIEVKHDDDVT